MGEPAALSIALILALEALEPELAKLGLDLALPVFCWRFLLWLALCLLGLLRWPLGLQVLRQGCVEG